MPTIHVPQVVAQHLAKDLPVLYNEKVVKVEYCEDGVIVRTSSNHNYKADAVIFTASLGVLKARDWLGVLIMKENLAVASCWNGMEWDCLTMGSGLLGRLRQCGSHSVVFF